MGTKYNPRVVTNGLSTYFDVANTRSYVGSGITVNGLVSGIGLSLVNGVGFGTTATRYFIFDGVDDNIPFNIPNVSTTISIEMWARIKSFNIVSSFGMPFGFAPYNVITYIGLGYNTANSDQYGLNTTQVTNLGLLNQWKHYVFEMRSDVSYSNNKIYINGQSQTLSQVASTELTNNRHFNSGNGRISSWLNGNDFHQAMDIAQFRIYNRALTAFEVLQNYNATKMRYGL
jgi:hypothetical protein